MDRAGRSLADAYVGPAPEIGPDALQFAAGAFENVDEFLAAAAVVRTWRAAHAYPLRKRART